MLFAHGVLNAVTQTIAWSVIFYLASAGASSGDLTVSEVLPLETRAIAVRSEGLSWGSHVTRG